MMTRCGVSGVNSTFAAMKAEESRLLTTRIRRKPKWRMMGAAVVFMTRAPADEAKVSSPDASGDKPKVSCNISGSRKGMAPMPTRNSEAPSTPARNVVSRSSVRSMTALGRAVRVPHIKGEDDDAGRADGHGQPHRHHGFPP